MTDKIRANPRALGIEYAIRDVVVAAQRLERRGEKVLKLNIGDPCQYDFQPPKSALEGVVEAMEMGLNGYAPSQGIPEVLEEIEKYERWRGSGIPKEKILVTAGVTEAIQFTYFSLLKEGDEILLPDPTYPPYITYAKMLGVKPVLYECNEEEGWMPVEESVRSKITERTRALAIINPNNPTGALYDEKTVRMLGDIAGEHSLPVISDEIYCQITFTGWDAPSTARVLKDIPVITYNGMSKIFLAPGWRVGYMGIKDDEGVLDEVWDGIMKQARARLSPSSIAQWGYMRALQGDKGFLKEFVKKLDRRRGIFVKRLREMEGVSTTEPLGAFYIFPRIEIREPWRDDKDFVLSFLEEEKTLAVHGSGFSPYQGAWHFRMVTLPEEGIIEEGMNRLERFLKRHIKG
ncbi:MAG: aminotransferase class I/II-fold pyridoxal phosphate-dependent enzyme [Thermoplasmata archaeon]|nr:aminotransferase class I/II-fold pyridoxal phosphate-dependent enzyme [Thermoplasmata archaeon]